VLSRDWSAEAHENFNEGEALQKEDNWEMSEERVRKYSPIQENPSKNLRHYSRYNKKNQARHWLHEQNIQ